MAIVIDASVFCALGNKRDVHHKMAIKIIEETVHGKYGKPVTTDYIFDETITVVARKASKGIASELGNFLLNSEVYIAKIDSSIFQSAWELFRKPENFSFTDCSILAFMKTFGIGKLATFDGEFKKTDWIQVIDN